MFKWLLEDLLEVVKVLYSPSRAFRKMSREPKFRGVLLILIFFVSATIGLESVRNSKIFVEAPVLKPALVPSEGPIYNITEGFTSPDIPLKLNLVAYNWTGIVTVYGTDGTNETKDILTIHEEYIVYTTGKAFKTITNVTFSDPGDGKTQYIVLGIPDKYISVLEKDVSGFIFYYVTVGIVNFFWNWGICSIVFSSIIKAFRIKAESTKWYALFIILGYPFMVMVIELLIYTLVYVPLPPVNMPLRVWSAPPLSVHAEKEGNQIFSERWGSFITIFNLLRYIPYFIIVWRAILSTVATYFLYDLTWKRAIIVSSIASLVASLLIPYGANFLLGGKHATLPFQ